MEKPSTITLTFSSMVSEAIERAKYYERLMAVLLITVNPRLAAVKTAGVTEQALEKAIVNRINTGLRTSDRLQHIEEYKFGIILDEIAKFTDANTISNRIINLLSTGFTFGDHAIPMDASIGISLYPLDGNNDIELISKAGMALAKAQEQEGSYYQCFSAESDEKRRFDLIEDLHYALRYEQFSLCYQPIFDLRTKAMAGVEVLIRWNHPTMGNVSPDAFIPSAIKAGLILPIGEWVLKTACDQLHRWRMQGFHIACAFINVSILQLQQPDFLAGLKKILVASKIDPTLIGFDITEVSLMKDIEIVNNHLRELRKLGIRIAIDDFGTGYTSLVYLKKLPINCLKIDRIYTGGIPENPKDTAIVSSVLSLSKTVGVDVIAEGVETEEQMEFLREQGCQYAQGYFLSRPLPTKEMTEYLAKL